MDSSLDGGKGIVSLEKNGVVIGDLGANKQLKLVQFVETVNHVNSKSVIVNDNMTATITGSISGSDLTLAGANGATVVFTGASFEDAQSVADQLGVA